jgi:hypothetical protein
MHACSQCAQQISGIVPLRQLVQPGWWAAAQLCQGLRQPLRLCHVRAASSFAQAPSDAAPSKPLFSSRAKIAEACVPWLKVSKNRYAAACRHSHCSCHEC